MAWPLRLTLVGLVAERGVRAFWPLWSVLIAVLAALMLGLQDILMLEVVWGVGVLSVLAALWTAVRGIQAFRWPTQGQALERLDRTLPGRPIAAISDAQAIGAGDPASEAVWRAHVARMAERAREAKAARPDLKLATRDPYALRYVALLGLTVALLFGSFLRVASVSEMAPGNQVVASGPSWEGWVEPPLYTGLPSLYLNDISRSGFEVPEGSRVTIRFYGEIGELSLNETVSARTEDIPPATDPVQAFDVLQSGTIEIAGPGGQSWNLTAIEDENPSVEFDGPITQGEGGWMEAPFVASDDYGVAAGTMTVTLDLGEVERRYGLVIDPEPRDPIELDIPITITGDRTQFAETVVDDFSEHPWANLPVSASLSVQDAAEHEGMSAPQFATLPGRRFFDPLAKAIIEQRRDLLWNRANAPRVAQVLRAVSFQPEGIFRSETVYLKLRFAVRRLETRVSLGRLTDEVVDETAAALWGLALEIEEGDLGDALERLRRAQDRLAEAIENGATDEEIAELMQELREAMQDYMNQLAQQGQGEQQEMAEGQEMQEMTGDQLQDMLDRLQELMEQGRMAEAQQLLDQLRQMMENMQVAQGQQGGQQSPGEQAMEGLAETLREQQGLSDEAFRDLQEQYNPNAQAGQSSENEGEGGDGEGRGAEHDQPGSQGEGGQQGRRGEPGSEQPGGGEGSLADRQQALRNELNRQQQNLPGAGTPEGDAARESLGRAGEAMDDAEEALRQEDFAEALDSQSQAMEALREGMRELAEQMAEQQQQQGGQQGQQLGQNDPNGSRDPLGREAGENGRIGTDEQLLQGDDVYRRARELLDEIRKRSGEQNRPTEELEYLKRLLERF
ncbi:hypothetical protein BOA8489_01310 [Boseongicola aestuarii]|uniref:TIGR02302 family protein n=1 Tax=Boseongicola aestuarii TaxID=1470561 RepID=A0A238IXU3_9RHOB|nr:hypothetical protein BOA8489_01310 [Boseongicola aestuarii]